MLINFVAGSFVEIVLNLCEPFVNNTSLPIVPYFYKLSLLIAVESEYGCYYCFSVLSMQSIFVLLLTTVLSSSSDNVCNYVQ